MKKHLFHFTAWHSLTMWRDDKHTLVLLQGRKNLRTGYIHLSTAFVPDCEARTLVKLNFDREFTKLRKAEK